MQVKDLVTFYINDFTKTVDVSFRMEIDSEEEVRNDSILIEEVKNFGYNFFKEENSNFFDDEEFLEEDTEEPFIDDSEIISFLNEYYMVNDNKIPSAELF